MTSQELVPRVGVAAIICNQKGQILVGQRIGSHGAGTWQLPGGHLDFGEEPLMCAKRETKEETDIDVKAVELVAVTNDVFRAENKHYITLYAFCEMQGPAVTPKIMEPNKCLGWAWKTWAELKEMRGSPDAGNVLFLPLENLLTRKPNFEDLRPKNQPQQQR